MDNHTQRFMDECKPGQRVYQAILRDAGRVNIQGWAALTIMSWDDFRQKNWETLQVESLVSTEPGL
jgi:hypothetical protein